MKLPAVIAVLALSLTGCGKYETVDYETGFKGAARLNPWLAAERFTEQSGRQVLSLKSWRAPGYDDDLWIVPVSVLSNASYVKLAADWVDEGGHLVLLLENAGMEMNDWGNFGGEVDVPESVEDLLGKADIEVKAPEGFGQAALRKPATVKFEDHTYKVEAGARATVAAPGHDSGVFASGEAGHGRITAVADARMFRNRWIGDQDHAALLLALLDSSDYEGAVMFSRGGSLSFWKMVKAHLGPVLIGLAALLVIWLWKNMPRFGPLEAAEAASTARGYDAQLAAVGGYHWRTNHASAMLALLRERLAERAQRAGLRAARGSAECHDWLAERSGLPTERVAAALSSAFIKDRATFTRVTADLQSLLRSVQ